MKRRDIAILLAASAMLIAPAARAGDPAPFAEFTFKRVSVPKPGVKRRINIQIEPKVELPAKDPAPAKPDSAPPAASDAFAWYWQDVSPDLAAVGPERLQKALLQLGNGPGVQAPRMQTLQDIAARHGATILQATIGTKVSPALVLSVIGIESSGRPNAVSSAGAYGLMQLMPATATRFGVLDSADPVQNIRGGVAYLNWLMEEFGGDPVMVLASYNAGENAVRKHLGVPPYAETRAYVPKVLAAWTVARGLCLTPPELISDGCVFAVRQARSDG